MGTSATHAPGAFIEPDPSLAGADDLHERLGVPVLSGHRADIAAVAGDSPVLARVAQVASRFDVAYEDQCSAQHYADLVRSVERLAGPAAPGRPPTRRGRGLPRRLLGRGRPPLPSLTLVRPITRLVDIGSTWGDRAACSPECLVPR